LLATTESRAPAPTARASSIVTFVERERDLRAIDPMDFLQPHIVDGLKWL
jgi:hypothetical protein